MGRGLGRGLGGGWACDVAGWDVGLVGAGGA